MWKIPADLLDRYISAIERMRALCRIETAHAFDLAHQARARAHDEILKVARVGREDKVFAFWLATTVEDAITARREADELRQSAGEVGPHS